MDVRSNEFMSILDAGLIHEYKFTGTKSPGALHRGLIDQVRKNLFNDQLARSCSDLIGYGEQVHTCCTSNEVEHVLRRSSIFS